MLTSAVIWLSEFPVMGVLLPEDEKKVTSEALARLDPVSVRPNVFPAGSEGGFKLERDGAGPTTTAKRIEFEVPTGLATLKKNWPCGVDWAMVMLAVTCVPVELMLLKLTPMAWGRMLEVFCRAHPSMATGKEVPGAPARGAVSLMTGPDESTVKARLLDVPPPVVMVKLYVPGRAPHTLKSAAIALPFWATSTLLTEIPLELNVNELAVAPNRLAPLMKT